MVPGLEEKVMTTEGEAITVIAEQVSAPSMHL